MAIKTISEGMSNAYLIHGIGVLIFGCIGFLFSPFIGIPLIIFAIALFTATTGVQINPNNKSYRKFTSLFGYKLGTWKSLSDVVSVILVLSTEISSIRGILPGNIPLGRSADIQVRTYDLLVNDGFESIQVNDFLTYKNARKAFKSITTTLNIEGRDLIAEKLAENRSKRSRR